jgi:hypothetical protein
MIAFRPASLELAGARMHVNENKIIAAILTIATSARESRGSSEELGKENWRRVIKHYEQILAELNRGAGEKP